MKLKTWISGRTF